MKLDELMTTLRTAVSARAVFGEPVEQGEVTVIPAARVFGGGGGGQDLPEGEGLGLGYFARPVGAFVVERGRVRWVPAVDVTRLVTTAGAAVITCLLAHRSIVRAKRG
ncbi:GerW family sporulation protein [Amycolatopsis sp. NPDC059027]|uniref:GerW family sporulation protein n=1 Tax=unclassified Amycolatopsis TaxID=2618356 RepID=UPI00366CBE60